MGVSSSCRKRIRIRVVSRIEPHFGPIRTHFIVSAWIYPGPHDEVQHSTGGPFFARDLTMAKGLRSSVKKANKAKLRSRVFRPVEDARTERLSAKLLQLAAKGHPETENKTKMEKHPNGREAVRPIQSISRGLIWRCSTNQTAGRSRSKTSNAQSG